MRFLLAFSLVASLSACAAKKPAPKSAQPGMADPKAPDAPGEGKSLESTGATDERKSVDEDDAAGDGADPCEGGE